MLHSNLEELAASLNVSHQSLVQWMEHTANAKLPRTVISQIDTKVQSWVAEAKQNAAASAPTTEKATSKATPADSSLVVHKPKDGDYHIKTLKGIKGTAYGLEWPDDAKPSVESLVATIGPNQIFKVTAINNTHATLVPHADNTATFKNVTNEVLKKSKPKPADYKISSATSIEIEVKKFKEGHNFCQVIPGLKTPTM